MSAGLIKCSINNKGRKRQQGLSLLELTIVVGILTVTAAVALPKLSTGGYYRLENAAREIAEATRFARAEAIRTGIPHGVIFSPFNENVKVYSLPSGTPTYDVYHPVDKKLYVLNLTTDAATAGVDLLSYSIYYEGVFGNQPYIGFNTNGNPKFNFFGTDHMLSTAATITLSYAGKTSTVNVSPMIGRVTVQ